MEKVTKMESLFLMLVMKIKGTALAAEKPFYRNYLNRPSGNQPAIKMRKKSPGNLFIKDYPSLFLLPPEAFSKIA